MKRAELAVGDEVWIYHAQTRGWATILDLDATPGPYDRPSYTVRIRFDRYALVMYLRERNVPLRAIIRKRGDAA